MKNQNRRMTAIYIRAGGEAEGGGSSAMLRIQERRLTQYARQRALENIQVFSDHGGSGYPELQRLIAEIEADHVAALVVNSLDQLCCDYLERGHLVEGLLAQHNVSLHSLRENIDDSPRPRFPAEDSKGRRSN